MVLLAQTFLQIDKIPKSASRLPNLFSDVENGIEWKFLGILYQNRIVSVTSFVFVLSQQIKLQDSLISEIHRSNRWNLLHFLHESSYRRREEIKTSILYESD